MKLIILELLFPRLLKIKHNFLTTTESSKYTNFSQALKIVLQLHDWLQVLTLIGIFTLLACGMNWLTDVVIACEFLSRSHSKKNNAYISKTPALAAQCSRLPDCFTSTLQLLGGKDFYFPSLSICEREKFPNFKRLSFARVPLLVNTHSISKEL